LCSKGLFVSGTYGVPAEVTVYDKSRLFWFKEKNPGY